MKVKYDNIFINDMEYSVVNTTVFDDIVYYLLYSSDIDKVMVGYFEGEEFFQLINDDNYREILEKLYNNINN